MIDIARIPTTAQLRLLESSWIRACHPNWGMVLMEVAGLNAAQVAMGFIGDTVGGAVVVCGRGNNGGDGLVVARHLHQHNIPVLVFMIAGHGRGGDSKSESEINRKIAEVCSGLEVHELDEDALDLLEDALSQDVMVVDALLGTGLDREVSGLYADAIGIINACGKPVLSIDVPSGIHSDTGTVMGTAIIADSTVTFGYLKAGLLQYPGVSHAGDVIVTDIGLPNITELPPPLQEHAPDLESSKWWLATSDQVAAWLPERPEDGHKGTFGRVLVVAGSRTMSGSSMLASRAVLRSGAGYAVLATAASLVPNLPPEEIVYRALPESESGAISSKAVADLEKEIERAQAILLGPGLGEEPDTVALVEQLLKRLDKPCIVDADGLNAISKLKNVKLSSPENVVFTPHPKELERLSGTSVNDIQRDRIKAAESASKQFGCSIVLKGARTIVATPNDGTFIIPTGNSGMATPGAGDVLSGIIAGLMAQGLRAPLAAVAGAYVHGAAGDLASDDLGDDGVIASDIMLAVAHALAEIRGGDED